KARMRGVAVEMRRGVRPTTLRMAVRCMRRLRARRLRHMRAQVHPPAKRILCRLVLVVINRRSSKTASLHPPQHQHHDIGDLAKHMEDLVGSVAGPALAFDKIEYEMSHHLGQGEYHLTGYEPHESA